MTGPQGMGALKPYLLDQPRTILFSDDFNRADSANLGSDWTPDTSLWGIFSNFAYFGGGTAADQIERVVMSMGGPNHWVAGTIYPPTLGNPFVTALMARYDPAGGGTHYAVWKDSSAASGDRVKVARGTAPSNYTTITSAASIDGTAANAGSRFQLEVQGTTLRVYQWDGSSWDLIITTTDSTYSAGDYVGIAGQRLLGVCIVEDFEAGIGWI